MRVGVAGIGLIGGSVALALGREHEVVAFDPDPSARSAAAERGLRTVATVAALLPAEAIVVATPLRAIVPTLEALAATADGALLLDVGSLKADVVAYAERAPDGARIVGGHPMAGSTGSGIGGARADLFRERPWLLVPTARSDRRAMALAGEVVRAVGAVPTVVSAAAHDRMVAMLSGVPLAIALALARAGGDVARFAGPGYRDATRLAATPDELARAILGGNAANVRDALARFRRALDDVERELS